MAEHGSAAVALQALPEVAQAAGVKNYQICPQGVVIAEWKAARLAGARPLAIGDPIYPARLADLPDAPPILWTLGDPGLLHRPLIALVGARNASSLGTRMARRLAAGLAEAGFAVVSGLARGIDTAAHLAALDHATLAVMAGGVDVVYPAENAVLAQEIADKGLRLSEQPVGMQPQARHFPARNRIISGIAQAVVVVEAAAKSGSLITARNALDQGREVLAVPGHPFDSRAAGCNALLRDGAVLVRSVEDVIEAFATAEGASGPDPTLDLPLDAPQTLPEVPKGPDRRPPEESAALHAEILSRLGPSPVAEDQLIRDLALPTAKVTSELVALELDGQITRQAGGLLSRAV